MTQPELTQELVLIAIRDRVSKGNAITDDHVIEITKSSWVTAGIIGKTIEQSAYRTRSGTSGPTGNPAPSAGDRPLPAGQVGVLGDTTAKTGKNGGFAAKKPRPAS